MEKSALSSILEKGRKTYRDTRQQDVMDQLTSQVLRQLADTSNCPGNGTLEASVAVPQLPEKKSLSSRDLEQIGMKVLEQVNQALEGSAHPAAASDLTLRNGDGQLHIRANADMIADYRKYAVRGAARSA